MNIFSDEIDIKAQKKYLSKIIGDDVMNLKTLHGGANRKTLKITTKNALYTGKFASKGQFGAVKRVKHEYESLKFLNSHGVDQIPQPVKYLRPENIALYYFLDGYKVRQDKVSIEDLHELMSFIMKLHKLSEIIDSQKFSHASEACFSLNELKRNIDLRVITLLELPYNLQNRAMIDFLKGKYLPLYRKIYNWSSSCYKELGIGRKMQLERNFRTLSPSDIGFHNAIKTKDGSLIVIDFEHFGWDDPGKLISDFLLHPQNKLTHGFKVEFIKGLVGYFPEKERLYGRIKALYPMFGLKWVLILLNEYLEYNWQRRKFASSGELNRDDILQKQLIKAKKMVDYIELVYDRFPYKI